MPIAYLTPAMRRVVDQMKALGGIAFLGVGVNARVARNGALGPIELQLWALRQLYGERTASRFRNELKRLKVNMTRGVWVSPQTYRRLRDKGVIVLIETLPAVWRLTEEYR